MLIGVSVTLSLTCAVYAEGLYIVNIQSVSYHEAGLFFWWVRHQLDR